MAEPAAGITRATSFGEREPPASRSRQKGKAPVKGAAPTVAPDVTAPAEPADAEEIEKHELDTMA
ncbi:MAG: hypothetical protein ABSC10_07475 [Candidatus Acidiferrales bacterium]|jgi:hypothetical protein